MLKIKSNTNEFAIIFSKKIQRKINAEKLSVQPTLFSTLSLFQPSFSFSFSAAHFFFFFHVLAFFCFSLSPFVSFLPAFFFSFQFTCALFFNPKTFFSAQNVFCLVQPLFSFVHASFLVSCQLLRPKKFSLDASHLFYLNKSLYSSNLE